MEYVVDIQGFRRSSNIFILKEMAVIGVQDFATVKTFHFLPPCKWSKLLADEQKTNKYLENHFHGIPWDSGAIPYSQMIRIVQETLKDATKIYVKGLQKKKWLEEILPNKYIYDLGDLKCASLEKITKNALPCGHHPLIRHEPVCAVKNVARLKSWILTRNRCLWIQSGREGEDYWKQWHNSTFL